MKKLSHLPIVLVVFAALFTIQACGETAKADQTQPQKEVEKKEGEIFTNRQEFLPDACALMSIDNLKSIIGETVGEVQIKDATNAQSKNVKSCFFRWEHEGMPNSGMLMQVQGNPLPDEFPDWAKVFVESKKTSGEKSLAAGGGELEYMYKNFPVGIDGAYNFELGKYYWRVDNEMVLMLAFNLPVDESIVVDWATQLAKTVKL